MSTHSAAQRARVIQDIELTIKDAEALLRMTAQDLLFGKTHTWGLKALRLMRLMRLWRTMRAALFS